LLTHHACDVEFDESDRFPDSGTVRVRQQCDPADFSDLLIASVGPYGIDAFFMSCIFVHRF
jgi:hypothetical protein